MAKVDLGVVKDIPVTLFSGDATGNVTLSETSANFSKIEILYEGYNGRSPCTLTVYNPNGKNISLSIVEDVNNSAGGVRLRRTSYNISGTSISLASGSTFFPGFTEIKCTTITENVSGNVIHITKVYGYR